jgi:hypothetical protein
MRLTQPVEFFNGLLALLPLGPPYGADVVRTRAWLPLMAARQAHD